MKALKSEWLKLVSVRTTWALLASMVLIEGFAAGLATSLGDIEDLRKGNVATFIIGTHLATVFMFTLGALLSTNEFRHGTANSTFVITPKRERVILAKLAVGLAVGIIGALLYIAVHAGVGLSILSSRGVDIDSDLAVDGYIGVGVGLMLGCLFGVALGAVLRNQVLTIIVGLVLFLLAGTVALFIGSDVGQFFPGEALLALQNTPGVDLLSQTDGGLVLAGYCAVLGLAGAVLTRRREIA
ncbi:MAG TPA: ABC transporter permease [Solirubrobacteraceae bacterium]|nr:ABC transporter permease [Solirubrobacteraceae bacterium]